MSVLNKLIVAALPAVPKSLVRKFANRYIAGEEITDAVAVVKDLNRQSILATLDVLGEDIHRKEEASASREMILRVFGAIESEKLDSNVSIKLTQIGLKLDRQFCLGNMRTIVARAAAMGNFVRIDMEDSSVTDDTLWVYRELRKEFSNVGIVLQAYLKRTYDDAEKLIAEHLGNFRLCKGIYIEPAEIAYKERDAINDNFKRVLGLMFRKKARVGVATHDTALIEAATGMIREMQVQKEDYEFQMLLGVRPELRSKLVGDGHRVRIYVPFGKQWYQYSVRRFKENPQIAGYVVKALFARIRLN